MKPQGVNALITAIRSDASSQIAGFLYQFVVALDYCFRLLPGQSIYIEKYGDVAIRNDGEYDTDMAESSIEVKLYRDELSAKHHNLLNTLYNWLENDFHFVEYQHLILYTTQPIKKDSPLLGWNSKPKEERVKIITDTYIKYLNDYKQKIDDNDTSKYRTFKENARLMKRVLYPVMKEDGTMDKEASVTLLCELLERVVIIDSCKNLEMAYEELMKYAKGVKDNLRESFINCLLGYIIRPNNMKNGWRITETSFTNQVQILTQEMAPQSLTFPDAPNITINDVDYEDALFVKKLKRIDYNRITEAIIDFAKTTGLLTGEFDRPSAEKNLVAYQEELLRLYERKYDNAIDNMCDGDKLTDEEIKKISRVFLRDLLLATHNIKLEPYAVTKSYFSEGMCHYMANDSNQNVKWLLNNE